MQNQVERFLIELEKSLKDESFIKLTLSNYKGEDKYLQKIMIRLVQTKKGLRMFFLYRYDTRDIAKNYSLQEGLRIIRDLVGIDFFSAHLFTLQHDFHLDIGKKGRARLNIGRPTFKSKPPLFHDKQKRTIIDPQSFYLKALGITNEKGEIREKQQDKWKQINRFIETLANFFDKSELRTASNLRIVDMGSGKGYLTFAVYDYFRNIRQIDVEVIGIEAKSDLVELCNSIAIAGEFEKLHFIHGMISNYELSQTDILIALHACNTATDDAIFKAIKAQAEMIVVAPCCHQEIRPQITPPSFLKNLLKHGVLLEQIAETITDGLRALLLEQAGYSTRVFEFISPEHTPKNNMIVALKRREKINTEQISQEIKRIKELYGIREQKLEKLLCM